MDSVSHQSSFFTWNATAQKVAASVAVIAGAILITGIVLAVLYHPSTIATALLAVGSGGLGLDLLYICLSQRKKVVATENMIDESEVDNDSEVDDLNLKPQKITKWERTWAIPAFAANNRQKLQPLVDKVLTNWEAAKAKNSGDWSIAQLAYALGISQFELKILCQKAEYAIPANRRIPTDDIDGAIEKLIADYGFKKN